MTWSTTNSESLWTYNRVEASLMAMHRSLMRASYSMVLFEAEKGKRIA